MKKFSVIVLSLLLILSSLAACGNSEGNNKEEQTTSPNSEAVTSADSDEDEEDFDEDPVEIVLAYYSAGEPNTAQLKKVEDAINEISQPAINVSVTLSHFSMGAWDQQINLMTAAGDQLDLMPTFFAGSTSINSLMSQNQVMPLNDLLDTYGQDIKSLIREEYFGTVTRDSNIYAVPVHRDIVSKLVFSMRTDILEELDLLEQAENISSMQDIEEIFIAVKENTNLIPLAPAGTSGVLNFTNMIVTGAFADAVTYDPLVDNYAVAMSDNPYEVVSLYDTQVYKDSVKMLEDWFNKGYIHPDAGISDDDNYSYVAGDKCFSYFAAGENATLGLDEASTGYKMTQISLGEIPVDTSAVNKISWTVPVTSKEPEAAMKFLNLMYTNSDIVNLLNYGIEGEDYQELADGTIDYPEGKDHSSVGYSVNMTWLFGNQYISKCWTGFDPDTREVSREINENAKLSPFVGFKADTDKWSTEMASITSAFNEFARALSTGNLNVDEALPQYQAKLEAAGIYDVIEGVQEQLDTWLEQK